MRRNEPRLRSGRRLGVASLWRSGDRWLLREEATRYSSVLGLPTMAAASALLSCTGSGVVQPAAPIYCHRHMEPSTSHVTPFGSPFAGGWQSSTFVSYETPAANRRASIYKDEMRGQNVATEGLSGAKSLSPCASEATP